MDWRNTGLPVSEQEISAGKGLHELKKPKVNEEQIDLYMCIM